MAAALLAISLAPSAAAPQDQGVSGVAGVAARRVPQRVAWNRGTSADTQATTAVAAPLSRLLGVEDAVQVAITGSRVPSWTKR